MFNWTENQGKAVRFADGSLLVGAGAGSGKTAVLAGRFVSLVENGADADRILVLTFSTAAASELRARIKRALSESLAKDPKNARLRRQLRLLSRASIGTVHSFCASLLRDNCLNTDVSPDFSVADALASREMRQTAMEKAAARLYEDGGSGYAEFADSFGRSRTDADAAAVVERFHEFLSMFASPEEWKASLLNELNGKTPFEKSAAGKELAGLALEYLDAAERRIEAFTQLCSLDAELNERYLPVAASDAKAVQRIKAELAAGKWDGAAAALRAHSFSSLRQSRDSDEALREAAKHQRDEYKVIFKTLRERVLCETSESSKQDDDSLLLAVRALFRAESEFDAQLKKIKRRKKMLEFSDLELGAIRLLEERADEISARFDYIMVDEFQDTNEVQYRIFELLQNGRGNLFAVGDVKQSIYSFRRADVEIFRRLRNEGAFLPLNDNFRSSPDVIDAINAVFSKIFFDRTGGADYSLGEALVAASGESGGESALEVRISAAENESDAAAEARDIAEKVCELITNGAKAGDVAVLVRSKENASEYADALTRRGVPVYCDTSDTLFDTSEIMVLLSLLRVVDNPRSDLDIAAVILSPLFGFDADFLASLKTGGRDERLFTLLKNSHDERAAGFVKTVRRFEALKNNASVGELTEAVVDELDAELLLSAGGQAAVRTDNIRSFLGFAASYDKSDAPSLAGFIRLCDRARERGFSSAESSSLPKDKVAVISVHKAKGLEWDYVFLADAAKGFNLQDSRVPPLLFDPALGVGAKLRCRTEDGFPFTRKTLRYRALAASFDARSRSEEMRVLYVALTRAKKKIFVTAAFEKTFEENCKKLAALASRGEPDVYEIRRAGSFLDWVLLGAFGNSEEAAAFEMLSSKTGLRSGAAKLIALPPAAQAESERTAAAISPDYSAERAQISARLSCGYPHEKLRNIPSKMTVSGISEKNVILKLPFFSRTQRETAAKRGTATHLFMECADYAAARLDAGAELKRLVENDYIDSAAASLIDMEKLRRFFESELAGRIIRGNILREYEFVDAVDAKTIIPDAPEGETIMVQGIADCVIVEDGGLAIVDYKTDKVKDEGELVKRYAAQLALYERAIEKRLGLPVREKLIYSFELGKTIKL